MTLYENKAPFKTSSYYYFLGPVCVSVVVLLGFWASLGVHVSLWPCYVDFHLLWFIITIQSRERGKYQESNDIEWVTTNDEL